MSYRLYVLGTFMLITGCAQFPLEEEQKGIAYLNDSYEEDSLDLEVSFNQSSSSERFLLKELKRLESSQHQEDLELYRKHRERLKTVSEKIYFLKLSPFDRRDYLVSRGFLSEREAMGRREPAQYFKLRKDEVAVGMRKPDVMDALGKPFRVEVAGNPRHENERWLYRFNGAPKYIYFEAGEVQGWE